MKRISKTKKIKNTQPIINPLISDEYQDTLFNAAAMIRCLQHIKLDSPCDETEYGIYLSLETVRIALLHEARKNSGK